MARVAPAGQHVPCGSEVAHSPIAARREGSSNIQLESVMAVKQRITALASPRLPLAFDVPRLTKVI